MTIDVLPYVYRLTDVISGEFYIGCRWANTRPSFCDIGYAYFTSSKLVNKRFKENPHGFAVEILCERNSAEAVQEYEQKLILVEWNNPKILNKLVHVNGKKIITGPSEHSEETIHKMVTTRTGKKTGPRSEAAKKNMRKPKSEIGRQNIKNAAKLRDNSRLTSKEFIDAANEKKRGRVQTDEEITKRMDGVRKYNAANPDKVAERIAKALATRRKKESERTHTEKCKNGIDNE